MPPVAGANYVLNVYVHKVTVLKQVCCIDENHETCVTFKFLEKITFDLCQPNEPMLRSLCPCEIKFDRGKTCQFLVKPDMSNDCNLYLNVWQKMSCACLPSRLDLGKAVIDLNEHVTEVNEGLNAKPIKGYYPVKNAEGEEVAILDMMMRVSMLDPVNLNDFTMNNAGNNFTVKGNDDPQTYMFKRAGIFGGKSNACDPAKTIRNIGEECCQGVRRGADACDGGFGGGRDVGWGGSEGGACTLAREPSDRCDCKPQTMESLIASAGGGAGGGAEGSLVGMKGEYEEIGATLNGNQIKIRLPKSKGSKGISTTLGDNQSLNAKSGERTMVFGQNEILLSMKQGGDGTNVCPDAFETKFQPSTNPNEGKSTMTITPGNVPQGVEALKVLDPDKDVFLLRINKKCRMADKANLELELVTPKPPPKPAKPLMESLGTQYDPDDCPPPTPPPEPEPEPIPEPVVVPPPSPKKKKGKSPKEKKGKDKKGKKK